MSQHFFKAVIFDLDGVITKTANVHSRAWKKMFDEYLMARANKTGEPFREFTTEDYLHYVDGKPRYDGVKSFLEHRDIHLPLGTPDDDPQLETVCGLGNRKNIAFNNVLKAEGVEAYPATIQWLEQLQKDNIRIGVASSSKNCKVVLEAAGLMHFVETRVDGVVSAETGLSGKPAPDIFVTAARNLGVDPYDAIVVEDATSGVQAGKNGNFGLVIGLAREDNALALKANGADIVVSDLEELSLDDVNLWFDKGRKQDGWKLSYHDFDPLKEKSREALMTVGNGFFGTRGAMEEAEAGESHYPGTYIAGMYNRLKTNVAGRDIENEDFVNVPNWLKMSFSIAGGEWFDPDNTTYLEISRELHLYTGELTKTMIVEDADGRKTQIDSSRFASMAAPDLAGIRYTISPLNYSATFKIASSLEGKHINAGVKRYSSLNQQHLEPLEQGGENDTSFLKVSTTQSGIEIAQAARLTSKLNDTVITPEYETEISPGEVRTTITREIKQGESFTLEKIVSIHTSQQGETDIEGHAIRKVKSAGTYASLLGKSKEAWQKIWQEIDIVIEGDRLSQKLLRLHAYHLMVSASPHNVKLDASVTARGLHGEAYRGHIFWDELFILPYYDVHFTDVARALLMYRYRRLDKAREYADEHGFKGAMYPWQSGSDGREETQVVHLNPVSGEWGPDHSSLQRHVSLAIAYNTWQYFHITDDAEFIRNYGAEMFFEICRFWADKSKFDETTGRYSIDGVMGPDEFHEMYPGAKEGGLRDNAYTNIMTAWMFGRVPALLEVLNDASRERIFEKTGLTETELSRWEEIHKKLNLVISPEGVISQYDGYFELKELDWDHYREKYGNIYRMDRLLKAEGKAADDYKVAKQADTLMTFYNLDKEQVDRILADLGYPLPEDYLERNLAYYLARTSHGSTLSRVVHAQLAEMIGDRELSWELYGDALSSDYNDIQGGTTAEGIHAGVMAGTLMIAVTTFAGIDLRENILHVRPALPEHWKKMRLGLHFKGLHYHFDMDHHTVEIRVSEPTEVRVRNEVYRIKDQETIKY
ncbi:MAG: beta-phosphoglucomutase family hydrolase [bacterium]